MHDDKPPQSEEELRKLFLHSAITFFEWNSRKNTPNILLQLSNQIEKLEKATQQTSEFISKLDTSLREANASSGRLSTVLNRLTCAYLIVTGFGVAVMACSLIYQIWFSK